MKFQTILLLVAASAVVLAKPELSEDENDTGVMSEPENNNTSLDIEPDIPVENPIDSISSSDVPNDTQEDDAANDNNLPQEEDENANNDDLPQDEGEIQEGDVADNAGEKSDDYEELNVTDDAKIDGNNEGEASEENLDDGAIIIDTNNDNNDDITTNIDTNKVENTNKENKIVATDDGEKSDDDSNGSEVTGIAVGIAGAAALSSAGIFIWVKKSKRSAVENAPLTMENIA
ncbi:hypothetical protein BCR32DRAFT_330938 [Anaeromyces robustus]|uniref:Mid2 domain-containing protein n=1 Tax=Anaeromyces robustus TaxID=1754192 RepID=A0A1Y1VMS2_9FUNG|nr:hypothetical protein BCR32DRAFT_330938 [Anaeromyces robustus]|eukprot:ORX60233.1 hypothetical protein BCR32DRAFT_330938 [Anaeromyces robustus]